MSTNELTPVTLSMKVTKGLNIVAKKKKYNMFIKILSTMKRDLVHDHTVPELLLKMWKGDKINIFLHIPHVIFLEHNGLLYTVFMFLLKP